MSTSNTIESMYRSFLRVPFQTSALKQGGKRKRRMRGGKVTRFGSTLSGTPNLNYLFGAPTGGYEGVLTPNVRGPEFLGGKRRRKRGRGVRNGIPTGLVEEFINPALAYRHTYPPIGTTIY